MVYRTKVYPFPAGKYDQLKIKSFPIMLLKLIQVTLELTVGSLRFILFEI